jgi:hypothetical protein
LIPDHVESVAEIMRRDLAFLVRESSGAIGVTLFTELPLLVCFSINDWLVGADIENNVSSPGWEDQETREARRM